MSKYIMFTPQEREIARKTDIAAFLESRGETLKRSGSEMEWKDGSQKVTIRGNVFFHQYERTGGDAISFVQWYYDRFSNRSMTYPQAVGVLLEFNGYNVDPALRESGMPETRPTEEKTKLKTQREAKPEQQRQLQLPPRNATDKRAFAYLCGRGIDPSVLSAFFKMGLIYESAIYHNAVFLGTDPEGNVRHAHLRGATTKSHYKGNATGCDPRYSFHYYGRDNTLFLFEAPIDMLSYISMHQQGWKEHSYAAACGVSDHVALEMLSQNPRIDTVFLCLDHDQAGQEACRRIGKGLSEKGLHVQVLCPENKDWNEDLQSIRAPNARQAMGEMPCMEYKL